MKEIDGYKTFLGVNLPVALLSTIDELSLKHKCKRTEIIIQMLKLGVFIESKMGSVDAWTSKDMEIIREQFQEGNIVDWVSKLDREKFSTLMHVFSEENRARGMTQKKLTDG